jgi:hypothetical protein
VLRFHALDVMSQRFPIAVGLTQLRGDPGKRLRPFPERGVERSTSAMAVDLPPQRPVSPWWSSTAVTRRRARSAEPRICRAMMDVVPAR